MMKKRMSKPSLSLHTETVRRLGDDQLAIAVGAGSFDLSYSNCQCPTQPVVSMKCGPTTAR
jgi:hypothetical protein